MELENKFDQDFLFYLGFTSKYVNKLKDCGDQALAAQWLQKLCGEQFIGIEQKRNRNIFLSNLLMCFNNNKLIEPFTQNPETINLSDSKNYFPEIAVEIEKPNWLDDVVQKPDEMDESDNPREDGRTYVATRTMPGGEGAFAYVAVNMSEDEPAWLGAGEGGFQAQMEQAYQDICPPQNEMEIILARRKDVKERQKVLTFYDAMMQNIADELDEKIHPEDNTAITDILEKLIGDLTAKGQYEQYEQLPEREQRMELLLLLFDKAKARRNAVAKREEVLDNIEASLQQSFFEQTAMEAEDKYEMPTQMWEYCINRPPNKKNLENMRNMYPGFVVDKFLDLTSNQKEQIAVRMQRRHENIVSQMKKELRKEGEKLRKESDEAKSSFEQSEYILKLVREAHSKQTESYEKMAQRKKGGETGMTRLYEEMKATIMDTQANVEEEADRGRILTEQINNLNAQSEVYSHITECSILKTEEANMTVMKNIKRLRAAVTQYENRLQQVKLMRENVQKTKQSMFIV